MKIQLDTLFKATLMTVVMSSLFGCAQTLQTKNDKEFTEYKDQILGRQAQAKSSILQNEYRRIEAQDVQKPYIAGLSIPLSREAKMPASLRASVPVTALFSREAVDLATALRQISQSTKLTIVATPDAYLSPYDFAEKTGVKTSPVSPPQRVILQASNTPLWMLLDQVASQIGVSWRPTEFGAEFFRVDTRIFELMSIPQTASTSSSLGRTGSAQNSFNSDSKTSFEMKSSSQIEGIRSSIDALLTMGGKFNISPESQTVVVTDTPEALDRIESFVKKQNKSMSRRIRLLVEAIDVVAKEGSDFGVDWNLVYNTTQGAIQAGSPSGLTGTQTSSFNFQQLIGPLSGSSLVVKALNEVGTVVNRRVFPLMTTNGRPITQALRRTFNYVDQVQTTAVASSVNAAVQAPTVTQKDETVGTFLTILPTAKVDGSVYLSVSFDVTTADPLVPYTVGSGASAITVQQKTINGSGVIQEVAVRSGKTEVIGGLELVTNQNTTRRLGDGVPILAGGSNTASFTRTVTVLLVTAVVEEGV